MIKMQYIEMCLHILRNVQYDRVNKATENGIIGKRSNEIKSGMVNVRQKLMRELANLDGRI